MANRGYAHHIEVDTEGHPHSTQRTANHTEDIQFTNHWTHKTTSYTPHVDETPLPYIDYERDIHINPKRTRTQVPSSAAVLIDHYKNTGNRNEEGNTPYTPTYMTRMDFTLIANKLGLRTNESAFTCLDTDITVPDEVKLILSFGPKFSVPIPFDDSKRELLLRGIHKLNKFHMSVYEQRAITHMAKEHIERTRGSNGFHGHSRDLQRFLVHCHNCVIRFFSENTDHVIAQADKGNITIVMKKEDYIRKVEEHLADDSTYTMLNASSHVGYCRRNETLLKKISDCHAFPRNGIACATTAENKIPNMYGLIKLHKEDRPIRPVVNTRSGPGYTIASILTRIFTPAQETHKYNVKNTNDVTQRLSLVTPDMDEFFASYDIKSMFTNISTEMAIMAIRKRYHAGKFRSNIPLELIVEATRFVTCYATEIEFNGKVYKQIRGLRMGSSLSSILSDFVTEDILDDTFTRIERPKLFLKYVDDCLVLARRKHIHELATMLNAANKNIIFEVENETNDGHITYLDIDIHNTHDYSVTTKWHQKPMASGRILNYRSTHPRPTIINTAKSYVYNIFAITHPDLHTKMAMEARKLLMINNYPEKIATDITHESLEKCRHRITDQHPEHGPPQYHESDPFELNDPNEGDTNIYDRTTPNERTKHATTYNYVSIPFFPGITPAIQADIRSMKPQLMPSGKPMSTMKRLYDRHKRLLNEPDHETKRNDDDTEKHKSFSRHQNNNQKRCRYNEYNDGNVHDTPDMNTGRAAAPTQKSQRLENPFRRKEKRHCQLQRTMMSG